VTRLRTGISTVRFPTALRYFSLLQNIRNASGAHPEAYSVDIGDSSFRDNGGTVYKNRRKLDTV